MLQHDESLFKSSSLLMALQMSLPSMNCLQQHSLPSFFSLARLLLANRHPLSSLSPCYSTISSNHQLLIGLTALTVCGEWYIEKCYCIILSTKRVNVFSLNKRPSLVP